MCSELGINTELKELFTTRKRRQAKQGEIRQHTKKKYEGFSYSSLDEIVQEIITRLEQFHDVAGKYL